MTIIFNIICFVFNKLDFITNLWKERGELSTSTFRVGMDPHPFSFSGILLALRLRLLQLYSLGI